MDFNRHCAEIIVQTDLLAKLDADLSTPVPWCPGWTIGTVVRHVGGGHRWAEETVRTRATAFLDDGRVRKVDGDDTGPVPSDWLREGAHALATTLQQAGPDAEVWTPIGSGAQFYARRFTHETLVHRADATLAAGLPFEVDPSVALDAIDEWMWLDEQPEHFEHRPEKRNLLGPGRTLKFVTREASWFVDLTGDVIRNGRGDGEAAVTVEADLVELLLVLYQRVPVRRSTGDRELLDLWLKHVSFG